MEAVIILGVLGLVGALLTVWYAAGCPRPWHKRWAPLSPDDVVRKYLDAAWRDARPTETLDSDVILEPGESISNHDPSETNPTMTIVGLGTGSPRPKVELDSDGRPIGRT